MSVTLLSGEQSRVSRRVGELVAGCTCEEADASLDGGSLALSAAYTPNLFGGKKAVVVHHASSVSADVARQLAAADGVVVAVSDRALGAAAKRSFGSPPAEHFGGKASAADVMSVAEDAGVVLRRPSAALLAEKVDGDVARVSHVVWQCKMLGWFRPSPQQVFSLVDPHAEQVPWELADAVVRGDVAEALAVPATPAAVTMLSSDVVRAARLAECGFRTGDAAELLGVSSWQARRPAAMARKLSFAHAGQALELCVQAATLVRTDPDPARLAVVIVRLCTIFASSR